MEASLTQHDDAISAADDWTICSTKLSNADETLAQRGEGSVSDFGPDSRFPGVAGILPSASEIDELDENRKHGAAARPLLHCRPCDHGRSASAPCRENCRGHGVDPVLQQADMTEFVAAEEYSVVIVPTGSIVLLDRRDALVRALKCFQASLQPGGVVALDVPPRSASATRNR